ncbi:hypothetical protein BJV77DRAFT_1147656 [Russula vinacea]|nr:hypothetical protein BJV77DRAFT_1147656 [Russula vinacea]
MGNQLPEPRRKYEFHLLRSLPDAYPIIVNYLISVSEILSDSPTHQEILWNFSRFKDEKKRLTLTENPYFYETYQLPTSPEKYDDRFQVHPTKDFWFARSSGQKLYVLTDKPEPTSVGGSGEKPSSRILSKAHPVGSGCPLMGWKCSIGCLPMHTSIDFGLRICTGQAASDSPLLVPLPPTSEQPEYGVVYRAHVIGSTMTHFPNI